MKRKNLMLSVAAAAVLGAFHPAFAGGDSAYDQERDPRAGAGNSADIAAGADVGPNAEDLAIEATPADADASAGASMGDSTAGADLERDAGQESESERDRLSELESADPLEDDPQSVN